MLPQTWGGGQRGGRHRLLSSEGARLGERVSDGLRPLCSIGGAAFIWERWEPWVWDLEIEVWSLYVRGKYSQVHREE